MANPMFTPTPNGHNAYDLLSGLQKFVRRSMEQEALWVCYELEGAGLFPHMRNRLEIIVYEDVGLENTELLNSIGMHIDRLDKFYKAKNSAWRLVLGTIILQACRGKKTRETDYFISAVAFKRVNGWRLDLNDYDFIFDGHTQKGKKLGRGREFFFAEAVKIEDYEWSTKPNYREIEMQEIDSAYDVGGGDAWEASRGKIPQQGLF